MKTPMTPGVAAAALFGGIAIIPLSIVWGGYWSGLTLSLLWGWFVVPVFALPALTLLQAYGLALVLRAARGYHTPPKTEDKFGAAVAKAFILPPVVAGLLLLAGWVAKSWM